MWLGENRDGSDLGFSGSGSDLGWPWLGSGEGPILREGVQIWSKMSKYDENDENDRFRHFMAV